MSQTDEPLVEDEEKKDTGRRAYFRERVGGADTFTGSFRGVPAHKHGGTQTVKPEDTIGQPDCWCGQVYGHDWPGKSKGAKHPRGDQMSAMSDEKPYLNPRDLRSWDRKVVRALCELVNTYGVNYRLDKDHMHIYLSVPGTTDEEVPRMKAGRSRAAEQSLAMLERWAEKYIRPVVTEHAAEALAAKLNDPTKKPHERTTKERSDAAAAAHARKRAEAPQKPADAAPVSVSTPVPQAPKPPSSASPAPSPEGFVGTDEDLVLPDEAPGGYHQHTGAHSQETNWWVSDTGKHYICKTCGWDHNGDGFAHQAKHSLTQAQKDARTKVSIGTVNAQASGRKMKVRNAIRFLAQEYDIPLATDRDATKIQRLEKQLAAVTAERDELKARYELAKEAFRL